jgi:hypothetical protein
MKHDTIKGMITEQKKQNYKFPVSKFIKWSWKSDELRKNKNR